MGEPVWAVHAVRAYEISATELICAEQESAEKYACVLSTDPGVLAGAVTRFVIDAPGIRTPVALYVAGDNQQVPHISDDRRVYANGHGPASRYAPR